MLSIILISQSLLTVFVYEASRPKDGDALVIVSFKRWKREMYNDYYICSTQNIGKKQKNQYKIIINKVLTFEVIMSNLIYFSLVSTLSRISILKVWVLLKSMKGK